MNGSEVVPTQLIIRRADGNVLADVSREPWRLPTLVFPGPWPPMDSTLTEQVRRKWGLSTFILDPVDFTTAVLQSRGPAPAPPGFGWVEPAALTGFDPTVDAWIHGRTGTAAWFRPDWYERAEDYLRDRIARGGRTPQGPVEQVKIWSMSTVLRTHTDDGQSVYFKAVLPELGREPVITQFLASLGIGPFADTWGHDPHNDWWLAEEFGGTEATNLPLQGRLRCIQQLANLHQSTVGRDQELLQLGAIDLRAPALAQQIDDVLARDDVWHAAPARDNRGRALAPEEAATLVGVRARLQGDLKQLETMGLPDTIVHRDLHPGNAVATDRGVLLHDWSFATVGNPLLDLASWLHDATDHDATAYLDTYFAAWSDELNPAQMRQAWQLAKPLSAVAELIKLIALADLVGQAHAFNWMPMIYGWARRLLDAVADTGAQTPAWSR